MVATHTPVLLFPNDNIPKQCECGLIAPEEEMQSHLQKAGKMLRVDNGIYIYQEEAPHKTTNDIPKQEIPKHEVSKSTKEITESIPVLPMTKQERKRYKSNTSHYVQTKVVWPIPSWFIYSWLGVVSIILTFYYVPVVVTNLITGPLRLWLDLLGVLWHSDAMLPFLGVILIGVLVPQLRVRMAVIGVVSMMIVAIIYLVKGACV